MSTSTTSARSRRQGWRPTSTTWRILRSDERSPSSSRLPVASPPAPSSAAPREATALGEASTVYTKFPRYQGVAERMAKVVPHARLIYVVRHPIDRIRSHYEHRVASGAETAAMEDAVFDNPIYIDYSRYALQVEQYLEDFPREQLLIISSEAPPPDRES